MTTPAKVLVIDLNEKPENQKLLNDKPQTCGMRSGRVYLSPGQACGLHSTKDREELLVFLSGQGELIIGQENREEAMQDLSLVVGNYDSSGKSKGVIGVIGPRRMDYQRAISSVNYLASLLSESLCESCYQEGA